MSELTCKICGKPVPDRFKRSGFCSFSCCAKSNVEATKDNLGHKCECEFCGEKFLSKKDLKRHYSVCPKKRHHAKSHTCEFCKKVFEKGKDFNEHLKVCEIRKTLIVPNKGLRGSFSCKFCEKVFPFERDRKTHERICRENPDREKTSWEGKHHTEAQKRKLSETQKRNLANGKVFGYKLNHSSKVSYPEQYFQEVFKGLSIEYNYQVERYQLDFAIPEKMVYVEIDGEQHFVDKRIVEHDKERTERLSTLGWKCLRRVRWSEYQKLSQNEKENYCNELINELQNI